MTDERTDGWTDMTSYRDAKSHLTSTAGIHQMRPFCRHSFIIVVVIVVVDHLKSFQPQKQQFSLFENNTGQTDGYTDGWTDTTSYRVAWSHLKRVALEKPTKITN